MTPIDRDPPAARVGMLLSSHRQQDGIRRRFGGGIAVWLALLGGMVPAFASTMDGEDGPVDGVGQVIYCRIRRDARREIVRPQPATRPLQAEWTPGVTKIDPQGMPVALREEFRDHLGRRSRSPGFA